MIRLVRRNLLAVLLCALGADASPASRAQDDQPRSRAAYLVIDARSHKTIAASRLDVVQTPLAPGSIAKLATLVAALEERVIEPGTRLQCARHVTVGSHDLTCIHPDLHRPLSPSEALAYSCNAFFATVARRLSRPALNRALIALGLPPSADADVVSAALGLAGFRASPSSLLDALVRIAANSPPLRVREETRQVLVDGLRGCATYGTGSIFGARKIDALAKTGTAPTGGGGFQGIVVASTPAVAPSLAVVVVAPGAAGADAAALAADLIEEQTRTTPLPVATPDLLKVGQTGADGKTGIVAMTMDDYVASVVAGEQHANSPSAALEALAVTARTYALANRRRHAREGFDLCDLTHCQVLRPPTEVSRAASATTRGRVLLYAGRPASVFYTAACGGRTERGDAVWPQATFPFLSSQVDLGCERLPGWSSELRTADLERALRAAGLNGQLENMRVVARTPSGRAATVQISGFAPPEIDGDALRFAVGRMLGWQHVKSTLFEIRRTATGYRFTGRGSGHGVGLCMVGSIRWATQGLTADDILRRYFPGLIVGSWPAPPETAVDTSAVARVHVEVPAVNAGERRYLTALVQSELDGLAHRLGVEMPAGVVVVFHPTVESYRRSTKQPWWIAAATTGQRVDLLPIVTLRAKGLIEQTVRHELVHVLTVGALRERPMWVKEGAALFFAGEVAEASARATTCPPKQALSVSSHRDASRRDYQEAGSCFATAIASGLTWSEIR